MKLLNSAALLVPFFLSASVLSSESPEGEFFAGQVELLRLWLTSPKYGERIKDLFGDTILPSIGFFEREELKKLKAKWREMTLLGDEKLAEIHKDMQETKRQIQATEDPKRQQELRDRMQELIDQYQVTSYKHSGLYELGPTEKDREDFIEAVETWVAASKIPELLEPFAKYT